MRSLRLALRPAPTPAVPLSFAENLERIPASAACARHLVAQALGAWGLPQLCDTATLVLTELVSNAVRHATGEGMRVNVTRLTERRVRVSVLDRDTTRPRMRDQDPRAERGRGLVIVEAESALWGVDLLPGGKRVWADVEAT
jgi:anti-sigma regulatory factor (Ser/Thr protein kinase)